MCSLVRSPWIDPSDTLLPRVEHTGGIAADFGYTETVTSSLPPLAGGMHQVTRQSWLRPIGCISIASNVDSPRCARACRMHRVGCNAAR
jgi:hypothetical protein